MSTNIDSARWDMIHRRLNDEGNDHHTIYAEEKEKLFPRSSIVCDLGGGSGADALYFLKMGHQVVLLDISTFALKEAEKKAKIAGFRNKLITRQVDFGLHTLPLKDSSIDVVFSRILSPFHQLLELIQL